MSLDTGRARHAGDPTTVILREGTAGNPPDSAHQDLVLGMRLELHPKVALRPEPFGALAYHYDNRRLVFLRHRDIVTVVEALASHTDVRATLEACDIAPRRWGAFTTAISSLLDSEVIREREGTR